MNPHSSSRSGIVLAGGNSSRMGRDKLALTLGGVTLLERAVRTVCTVAGGVVIAGCPDWFRPPAGVQVVPDAMPDAGPLSGLLAGLRATGSLHAVVVAADLPFLESSLLRYLLELGSGVDAVVPRVASIPQTMLAVYATALTPLIEQHLGTGHRSLQSLISHLRIRWVDEDELRDVTPNLDSFINVNTPSQWRDAMLRDDASFGCNVVSPAEDGKAAV